MADVSLLFNILARDNTGSGVNAAAGRMEKMSGRITKALAAIGVGAAGKMMVDLSRNIEALDKKAKVVFGDALPGVQAWAEANKTALGLTSRETTALAVNMADLLKPMGFTSEQAAKQSQKMLDLAGALSAWSGGSKSAAEVGDLLTDAMLGETDGLKALGISLSAAEIDATLAAKGQDKLTGAALAQAQALATQELILAKSTDAQTAWKNGAKEAAEAQNNASVKAKEAKEALAVALTPAIRAATESISKLANWVQKNETKAKILAAAIIGLAGGIWAVNTAQKAWMATQAAFITVTRAAMYAQLAFNASFLANPIVLVTAAVAGLVAGLVIMYKKWDTARYVMNRAIQLLSKPFFLYVDAVLWGFEKILRGLGHLPKWLGGGKFDQAADAVAKLRDGIKSIKASIDQLPTSKAEDFTRQLEEMGDALKSIPSVKNVYIDVQTRNAMAEVGSAGSAMVGGRTRAKGGPVKPNEWYLVGEKGPEVILMGSRPGTVVSNKDLRAGRGGWGGPVGGAKVSEKDATGRMTAMLEKLKSAVEKAKEIASSIREAYRGFADITKVATGANFTRDLAAQADHAEAFARGIAQLRAKGLNKTSIDQLIAAGPEQGLGTIEQLLNRGGIGEANRAVARITAAGAALGEREARVQTGYGTGTTARAVIGRGKHAQVLKLDLAGGADELTDAIMKVMRKRIRASGGNVQLVLGTGKS